MEIDTFAWAPPIPRAVFEDKDWLYPAVMDEWAFRLQQAGGKRIPGPLHVKVMHFGYIDDNTMEEVMTLKIKQNWTYAVVRVTGPAMKP
jgi:hypothetical protein